MQYSYIGHRRLEVSKLDFLCTLITHLNVITFSHCFVHFSRSSYSILNICFTDNRVENRYRMICLIVHRFEDLAFLQFIFSSVNSVIPSEHSNEKTKKKKNKDNNTFCGNENSMHRVIRMQFGHGSSFLIYPYISSPLL